MYSNIYVEKQRWKLISQLGLVIHLLFTEMFHQIIVVTNLPLNSMKPKLVIVFDTSLIGCYDGLTRQFRWINDINCYSFFWLVLFWFNSPLHLVWKSIVIVREKKWNRILLSTNKVSRAPCQWVQKMLYCLALT